jgi:predicted lipoprotein with Yx(FWY)xxD motif
MNMQFRPSLNRKLVWLSGMMVLFALILTACQGSIPATGPTATAVPPATKAAPKATATKAPEPTKASAAVSEAEISVAQDAKFGSILVGNKGMTLYMFTKDTPNKSNCAGGCLAQWPPLLTQGSPVLGDGVDAKLVGSADMPDGTKIVTYNGMPLYYWINDKKPGDTTGQDVGGVWYLVSPDGKVIEDEAASSSAGTTAAAEAEINVVNDPKLGSILVGSNGMTLYMFTKDAPNKSNCDAGCLAKWPPLLTKGTPKLGDGVDASLVGSADLADGSKIVTYNGMPLYYWVKDTKAGDTTGQGVGSVWYVVSPDGKVIGADASSSSVSPADDSEAEISVVNDPKLGEILVGHKGMTLYMFTKDEPNKSNCDAGCLAKWPPLLTKGSPKLDDGVDPAMVGSTDLPDGTKIVTYNGMPLYYWVKDTKAGDTTGQGVGSVWYVVSPDGKVVGQKSDGY